ncbi:hypothetical protein ACFL6C_00650 [Myxococcota bacterium]
MLIPLLLAACGDCDPSCKKGEECVAGACRASCDDDRDCEDTTICVHGYCEPGNRLPSLHCAPSPVAPVGNCPYGGPAPDPEPPISIDGPDALDSLNLEEQTTVVGDLTVAFTHLSTISGLECIVDVQGSVTIEMNPCLVNLDGLKNLETVAGDFKIDDNDALTLLGLDELTTVRGQLIITNNDELSQSGAETFASGIDPGGGATVDKNGD